MKKSATNKGAPLLRVENLEVYLPFAGNQVQAVRDVNFEVKRGKTLGLVGESGCGKSVLCRTLLGLLPHAAILGKNSRIYYKGENLVGLSEKAYNRIRAREIAIVFQDSLSALNPVMTIGKQIMEPLIFHKRMKPAAARQLSLELLQSVEVPIPKQRINQYPHQLSGGTRQRVAIAIALACEPKLLIADEPTTALDVTVQQGILELLGRLQKKRRMAVILVTHDLNLAASRAHDLAVMYAGRIVERAPAATLFPDVRMPYTKALIDSIPRLDKPPHTPLKSINGQPPNLSKPLTGCPFAPRCVHATARCHKQLPGLLPGARQDHLYACWYPLQRKKAS